MRFAYHNCNIREKADVVLIGVPDESKSYAERKGTKKGPDAIRKASLNRLCFLRKRRIHCVLPEKGEWKVKIHDAGNVEKKKLSSFLEKLNKKQIPVILGGDHSNSYSALKGLQKHFSEIALIHFDAHPDMIHSTKGDFGSVVYDITSLKNINQKKIIEVGIRSIEPEEKKNLQLKKITTFTSLDIFELGTEKIFSHIKKKIGKTPLYLSIDLDVIDPAFAPGVDTPASFGLTSNEYLSLIKKCAKLNLIGFDIMEMSPHYDIQQITAQIAAQSILEVIGSNQEKSIKD